MYGSSASRDSRLPPLHSRSICVISGDFSSERSIIPQLLASRVCLLNASSQSVFQPKKNLNIYSAFFRPRVALMFRSKNSGLKSRLTFPAINRQIISEKIKNKMVTK
jgi:hypothetical protein